MEKIKRFFTNKNTVTIIGLLLIITILYIVYNKQIKDATNPIKIPVAKVTIQPKTLITDDMIEYISVPSVSVKKNTIRVKNNIIGKYSNYNTIIPAGSMFYTDTLITEEQLPDASIINIKEGNYLYSLPVTMATTQYNTIMPGHKVDIYMTAINDDKVLMVGTLLSNVEVLAVKTSDGLNVFENSEERRTPAAIQFEVNKENYDLLVAASKLSSYSVTLVPRVPGISSMPSTEGTVVSTTELKEFINAHASILAEDIVNNESNEVQEPEIQYDEFGNVIGE